MHIQRQVPAVQVAQKTAEISQIQFIDRVVRFFLSCNRFSTNGADGPENRADYTNAVPGKGNDDTRCSATPGVHGSGGAENSVEEVNTDVFISRPPKSWLT